MECVKVNVPTRGISAFVEILSDAQLPAIATVVVKFAASASSLARDW